MMNEGHIRSVPGRKLTARHFIDGMLMCGIYGFIAAVVSQLVTERFEFPFESDLLIGMGLLLLLTIRVVYAMQRVIPRLSAHVALTFSTGWMWLVEYSLFPSIAICGGGPQPHAVLQDYFPLYGVSCVMFANVALLLIQHFRRPTMDGICMSCGYDMRGLPTPRCSECGCATTGDAL